MNALMRWLELFDEDRAARAHFEDIGPPRERRKVRVPVVPQPSLWSRVMDAVRGFLVV